jgi:hypothetical protein
MFIIYNYMELNPALGIGDLLITKMLEVSNDLNIMKINISTGDISDYKAYPSQNLSFLMQFIKFIFPETTINKIENRLKPQYLYHDNSYKLDKTYIYDHLKFNKVIIPYDNYIIFHTKVRIDHPDMNHKFNDSDIKTISIFLENYKTDKTILLLGDRHVEKNIETTYHNIKTLYDNLLILNNNNNVIDLTHENLCSGNDNFENFIYEMQLINNAVCNITFGIGGNFVLCQSFSKNNLCYVSDYLNHNEFFIRKAQNVNNNLYSDINKFLQKITDLH